MNKSQVLKIFNKEIKDFFKKTLEIFPKEDDIKSLNTIVIAFC